MGTSKEYHFRSPTAIGGYGAIIVTLITFFAQGGFGKMTSLSALYIVGLLFGTGLILYGIVYQPRHKDEQNTLLIEAKRKHLGDLRKVIQTWRDSLAYPINTTFDKYQVNLPASFTKNDWALSTSFEKGATWYIDQAGNVSAWFSIESDILFPCLKKHLQRPELWTSYQNLKNKLAESLKAASILQENASVSLSEAHSLALKVIHELDIALANRIFPGKCEACPDYHEVKK